MKAKLYHVTTETPTAKTSNNISNIHNIEIPCELSQCDTANDFCTYIYFDTLDTTPVQLFDDQVQPDHRELYRPKNVLHSSSNISEYDNPQKKS